MPPRPQSLSGTSLTMTHTGLRIITYTVDGETLTLETTPRTAGTDSRQFINTLTWERVEAFPLARPQET